MMWKNQITAATLDIDGKIISRIWFQVRQCDRTTFNMPTWTTFAKR